MLLYVVVYSCCVFLLSVLVACSCCIFLLTFDEQNSPFLPNAFPVPQHMVQPARFALFHAGTNTFQSYVINPTQIVPTGGVLFGTLPVRGHSIFKLLDHC